MLVSKINADLKTVGVLQSAGTAIKAVAIASAELSVGLIPFAKSVGNIGELVYLNSLELVYDKRAEMALNYAEQVEVSK